MMRGRRGHATAALCACASALWSPKRASGFVPVAGFATVTPCRHYQPHHLLWQSSALSGEKRELDASNDGPTEHESQSPDMDEEKAYPRATIFFGAFVALAMCAKLPSLIPHTIYMTISNVLYLFRRANLRRTTPYDILRIRTTLEYGVSLQLFALYIIAWQLLVVVFPLSESAARLCGHASFFYSYPNARGGAIYWNHLPCSTCQEISAQSNSSVWIGIASNITSVTWAGMGTDILRQYKGIFHILIIRGNS